MKPGNRKCSQVFGMNCKAQVRIVVVSKTRKEVDQGRWFSLNKTCCFQIVIEPEMSKLLCENANEVVLVHNFSC